MTIQEEKQKLNQMRDQIQKLEQQLQDLTTTASVQRQQYEQREKQFKEQLAYLNQLSSDQQMLQYESQINAQFKHFMTQIKIQLEKRDQQFQNQKANLQTAVDFQFQPLIQEAQENLEKTLKVSDDEILKRALPMQFVQDYQFLRQYSQELEDEYTILKKLLTANKEKLEKQKSYQQMLIREDIKQRQLIQSYKTYCDAEEIQYKEKQRKAKQVPIQTQPTYITQPQKAPSKDVQKFIDQELKQLNDMKQLPTPIRSFLNDVYKKFEYLLPKQENLKYEEVRSNKANLRLYKQRSVFEEKFQLEKLKVEKKAAFVAKIDFSVFEEIEKNSLMFETAAGML
ncbi:Hypothetical_protein [Hexamita inflata]|uniref:Hypothetical_protein n=1 Tax=Hexamita inflata TaxID=28002 RepID=A0AA86UKK9_9EUKA|nr:Hypothetical protein HINF_LOCUS47024 [Hexamita inflata]